MTVAPVTLNSNGVTIALSRDGDIVTAHVSFVSPGPSITIPNTPLLPFPAGYSPANNTLEYMMAINGGISPAPAGQWGLILDEIGGNGSIGIGTAGFGAAPYPPFSVRWLADPLIETEGYVLNPQDEQDSITAYLRTTYPHIPVIEDGLMDGDYKEIKYHADETVKPFIILWYSPVKRNATGRSFANYKLDSHSATVDVVVVSRNGTEAREILNDVADKLIGFRTVGGGRMHKGAPLWGDSRQVLDDSNKPSRWARTDRFDFGVNSQKVGP